MVYYLLSSGVFLCPPPTEFSGDANLNPSAIGALPSTTKRARKSKPKNYLHAAARTYHDLGLPITLCRGKAPWQHEWPTLSWTPRKIDATYRLQAAANVGLILGPRTGLVDFECDGAEAERTLLELFEGDIPETPTWRSRRGLHRLFRWHPALRHLGTSKFTIGSDGAKVDILIGPGAQTLLPPSWADGVQREWEFGDHLLPDRVALIGDDVLCRLGCKPGAEDASADTDSKPSSVVSVVSVVSVSNTEDPTTQRIMAAVERCLVRAQGTTNDKFMALAIALKGMPELANTMGEELEPYIHYWYEQSLPFMQETGLAECLGAVAVSYGSGQSRATTLFGWHTKQRSASRCRSAPYSTRSSPCGSSWDCAASFSIDTRTSEGSGT